MLSQSASHVFRPPASNKAMNLLEPPAETSKSAARDEEDSSDLLHDDAQKDASSNLRGCRDAVQRTNTRALTRGHPRSLPMVSPVPQTGSGYLENKEVCTSSRTKTRPWQVAVNAFGECSVDGSTLVTDATPAHFLVEVKRTI